MRWENLRLDLVEGAGAAEGAEQPAAGCAIPAALIPQRAVIRTFDTPQFAGMTFYEVRAKSIVNRVPEASRMPFRWTINPYRGCSHACVYCFARSTHTYLDLDAGRDFDTRIVVKVNAAELLRRELARPRWAGEHIAMGTNVDCYQRAEGRYRLMPGILAALRDAANPFSILTKGSLILRDLDLLVAAAEVTDVHTNVSVGFVGDPGVWRALEPGTPSPERRLEVCRALNDAGVPCGVLMAPIVPGLTDSAECLDRTVRAIAEAGAVSVSPIVLHLRPGAREWFTGWLERHHPELLPRYRELYRGGSYAAKPYQAEVTGRVAELARRYGIDRRAATRSRGASAAPRSSPPAAPAPAVVQEPLPLG